MKIFFVFGAGHKTNNIEHSAKVFERDWENYPTDNVEVEPKLK